MSGDYDPEEDGEYTRFKAKIQLGDGIDRRGDTTVEIARSPRPESSVTTSVSVGRGEEEVETTVDHKAFAEFALEVDRATELLRSTLQLPDDNEND